jgi:hypothetical protein
MLSACAPGAYNQFKTGVQVAPQSAPVDVKKGGKTFALHFADNTGHGVDMTNQLVEQLQTKGLQPANDDNADYIINANLTFIDVADRHPEGGAILAGAGIGAATGAIIANNTKLYNYQAGLIGLGAGLLVGAAANAIERANRPIYYIGTMGVTIKERLNFAGKAAAPVKPVIDKVKKTTKTTVDGKTTTTVEEVITEESNTPKGTQITVSKAGTGNFNITKTVAPAEFKTNQTELKVVYQTKGVNHSVAEAIENIGNMLGNSLSSNF